MADELEDNTVEVSQEHGQSHIVKSVTWDARHIADNTLKNKDDFASMVHAYLSDASVSLIERNAFVFEVFGMMMERNSTELVQAVLTDIPTDLDISILKSLLLTAENIESVSAEYEALNQLYTSKKTW